MPQSSTEESQTSLTVCCQLAISMDLKCTPLQSEVQASETTTDSTPTASTHGLLNMAYCVYHVLVVLPIRQQLEPNRYAI